MGVYHTFINFERGLLNDFLVEALIYAVWQENRIVEQESEDLSSQATDATTMEASADSKGAIGFIKNIANVETSPELGVEKLKTHDSIKPRKDLESAEAAEPFHWWEHINEINQKAAYSSFAVGNQIESLENREDELTFLEKFCRKSHGHLLVRGDAFYGKSSLLSWFFLHPPKDTLVTGFFIRKDISEQRTSLAMIHALYQQFLPWLKKRDIYDRNAYTEDDLKASIIQPLEDAAKAAKSYNKKLALIIDALDEDMSIDSNYKSIIEFLPKLDIENLLVIISCRPEPDIVRRYNFPCEIYNIKQTTNLKEIQAKVLYELEQFKGNIVAEDILTLLAICCGALTENDLIEIIKPEKHYYVSDVFRKSSARIFSSNVYPIKNAETAYRFGHTSFIEHVEKDFMGITLSQGRKGCGIGV